MTFVYFYASEMHRFPLGELQLLLLTMAAWMVKIFTAADKYFVN